MTNSGIEALREFSAGGLVLREGKVILVQVTNLKGEKVWTFPKGHVESGETALEAALREVQEETGWSCRSKKRLLTARYRFSRQGVPVSKRVEWFLMEPVAKVGEPDAVEVSACRWAAPKDARDILQYPSDFKLLDRLEGRRP